MPAGPQSDAAERTDDRLSDAALARIARLAKALARSRYALVSLFEGGQLIHHVAIGVTLPRLAVAGPFAKACLAAAPVAWREDAREDPALADHVFVTGEPRVRFWCSVPIRDQAGEVIGALSAFDPDPRPYDADTASALLDLATSTGSGLELQRMKAALEDALKQRSAAIAGMEAFVRHAPVGLAVLDQKLRFISASPRWLSDFQLTEAEVIGKSQYEVMPFTRRYAEAHARCLAGEARSGERFTLGRNNGAPSYGRWDLSPWRLPDGEVGGIIVMTYDITPMMEAQRAAEYSEQRLKLALEISEAVVWEMTADNVIAHASGALQALYGDMPAETPDRVELFSNVLEDDLPQVRAAWAAHKATGQRFRIEHRLRRSDGSVIWVQSVADTIRGDPGQPDRLIGVLMNITDRKLVELMEGEARRTAEAASRAKDEFLANMSHEIRTPLNGVMGVAGALARTELAPAQRQMVSLIETSAFTLERLLTDLLDLARIESGRGESQIETFNLGELLDGVAALFEPRAREKGVAFERLIAPATQASFNGDATRLKQILSNLLSNAVKFTDVGAVRLTADVTPAAEADLGRLRLTVEDTGIGFSPEDKERLFQRFEQADGSITRRFGGSGLGLSISRALAESLGGSLEADSQPGRGAVFTLAVDLKRVSVAAADAAHEQAGVDGADLIAQTRPPRILLAEDHPVNRKVVELILESAGVELTSVENGAEAVEQFDAQPFDLILMDMQMPVMDGLTAMRLIRERERELGLRRTPIVALTANAMPEHQEASRQAGADEHVSKPVSAQVLLDVVARQALSGAAEEMLIASEDDGDAAITVNAR